MSEFLQSIFDQWVAISETVLQWFIDIWLFIPKQIIFLYLEGLAAVLAAIPVPDIFNQFTQYTNEMLADSGIAYFAGIFKLSEGFAILITAYGVALLIRRIPGI